MQAEIDVNVPRFNQACVAALTGLAFVIQWWPLVTVVGAIVAVTRLAGPEYGLFTQVYIRLIRPRLSGEIETEPSAPPRFAQMLGIAFLGLATVLFIVGATAAGWIATLVITALATLAATTKICVGCIIYDRVTT